MPGIALIIAPMIPIQRRDRGVDEMFDAIYHGDCARVRELLSRGTPATVKGGNGEMALDYAASHGRDACVEALLEYGAVYAELPIIASAVPPDPTVMRRFLGMRSDQNTAVLQDALMTAAFYGNVDTVRLLLASGTDPQKKSSSGHSVFDAPEQWDCTPEEREQVLSLLRDVSRQNG